MGYSFLAVLGVALWAILYKGGNSHEKSAGWFVIVSSFVLSFLGLTLSYFGFEGEVYYAIGIGFGFVIVGMAYLALRSPWALIFLAMPFYASVWVVDHSVPFVVLYAALVLGIGVLDAHTFSKTRAIMLDRYHELKNARLLLAPFRWLGLFANRIHIGKWQSTLAFLLYLFPSILLVTVALALWKVSQITLGSEALLIFGMAYFAVASTTHGKSMKGIPHTD